MLKHLKLVFAVLFILGLLCGCENSKKSITEIDDLSDAVIGAMTGTTGEALAIQKFPDAEIKSFDDIMDGIAALKSGQIDAVVTGYPNAFNACKYNENLTYLTEVLDYENTAIALRKDETDLLPILNKFIADIREDGTLSEMKQRWFRLDSTGYATVDIELPSKGKTLRVGTSATREPFCFVNSEQEITGHDGELARRVAAKLGRPIQFVDMKFSALIPALVSGKVDMIISGMTATEERAKSVNFTDSYFKNSQVVLTKKSLDEALSSEESSGFTKFLIGIGDSFESNIIQENRYLLILDGLYTTILISIFATLFGTLLGGLICAMRMSRKSYLKIPAKVYISILRGTPVLVVLMIIFYVVFASVDIDQIVVAVIAFGLNFAAYVSEMFRTGIEGVDKGQTEAGIAMGFTKVKTFIFIVLPQAVRRILPVYKGEVISLVKMTSIVGYIAVQDLTKASDIIRSRTFDAFFPLIMVAVLYFLISWLLMMSLGYVERLTNPKIKTRRG